MSKGRSGLDWENTIKNYRADREKAPEAEIDVKELFKEMPEKIAPEVKPPTMTKPIPKN